MEPASSCCIPFLSNSRDHCLTSLTRGAGGDTLHYIWSELVSGMASTPSVCCWKYLYWASKSAVVCLALLLLSAQSVQASQAPPQESPSHFSLTFDLSVVRSRTLPWQGPAIVFEAAPSSDQAVEGEKLGGEWSGNANHPFLEFTLEESRAAIALFGCDCPAHLNQLRQLRGLPLL